MTVAQQDAPFQHEAIVVVETNENCEIDNTTDIVDVSGARTITLPAQPVYGQRHRIVAATGNVTVAGNGHTLAGGIDTVPAFKTADFVFCSNDTWVGSKCPT